jgi:hypothetical protein
MKSEGHCTLHINTPMGVVLSHLNPINIFIYCFPKSVEISSSHLRMPSYPQWSRTFGFTNKTSLCISCIPKRARKRAEVTVSLLTCILEVLRSDPSYTDWGKVFCGFSRLLEASAWKVTRWATTAYFQILSKLPFICHPSIHIYYII